MHITEDTKSFPSRAHPSDFEFLRRLIAELDKIPTKDKVTFPLPSRSGVFADVECVLGYDAEYKPYAEFFFRNRRHELEMAHSAVVLGLVDEGKLKYHLQITPNSRLKRNGHRVMRSNHLDAAAAARAICRNYLPGTVGRKVIPLVQKKVAPVAPSEPIGWPAGANGR